MNDLRVAIVGCGKIADSHVGQIHRIPNCTIVGACDREELMARQLCERFDIPVQAQSIEELTARCQPDIIHITTPPQSHMSLARQAIDAGAHVLVEKPFSVNAVEAVNLLAYAEQKQRKVCVSHDAQFSHAALRLRRYVAEGYLGGAPIHMESHWCYDLGDHYARSVLSDHNHWVRSLPGRLLHNIISHGLARISEYLSDGPTELRVIGRTSDTLRHNGVNDIVDELRVIISEEEGPTAYLTFSTQMRPSLHQFAVFGPSNGLVLDEDKQGVLRLRGERYKSYLEKTLPHFSLASQCLKNASRNVGKFLKRDFHMDAGKKHIYEAFYNAIREDGEVPIPYPEILRTSRMMDDIFRQLSSDRA